MADVSESFCMVVGSQSNHLQTIVLSRSLVWNGRTWRATHPLSPKSFAAQSGVSCPSASGCLAVGWRGHCSQPPQPLGQHCFYSLR